MAKSNVTKITKVSLQKENEALKTHIKELEAGIEQLKKDNAILTGKLQYWESLPKQAGDCISGATQWIMGIIQQPQGQQETK